MGFTAQVTSKGSDKWAKIASAVGSKYDIYVGLPNTGQRYTYSSYEYGPQKAKGAKKQSSKIKSKVRSALNYPLVALVAFWLEFGTADGKIPERSFLRKTIIAHVKKYIALNILVVRKALTLKGDLLTGFRKIGLVAENDVREAIRTFDNPPNAPSTIKQKGVNAPLKYKGTLVQSIRSLVKKL